MLNKIREEEDTALVRLLMAASEDDRRKNMGKCACGGMGYYGGWCLACGGPIQPFERKAEFGHTCQDCGGNLDDYGFCLFCV